MRPTPFAAAAIAAVFAGLIPAAAQDNTAMTPQTSPIWDISLTAIDNSPLPLSAWEGRPILVVNTASKCGFTPQYEGLQALWTEYEDDGLIILGIPSDNFGGQEYADNTEIADFCQLNFGVSFPLAARDNVVGADRNAIFARAEAVLGEAAVPKWNFHKILIGRDGIPVAAFGSRTTPSDPQLKASIDAALGG